MNGKKLAGKEIEAFAQYLRDEEREPGTIEKYLRDIRAFIAWVDCREINKELVAAWKDHLKKSGLQPETINSKLSALNKFFTFMGWNDFRVKYLKIQHKLFRRADKDLTKEEYKKVFDTAVELGKKPLALLMEVICAIRVSEVKYITVEAAQAGRTDISLKGKIRTILLPSKLCRKLEKYAKKQKSSLERFFSPETEKVCPAVKPGRNSKHYVKRRGWRNQKYSPTICGTCLPGRSTVSTRILSSLRMCWGTPALRQPEFTSSPPARNRPGSWNGWGLFLRARTIQNAHFAFIR